MTRLRRSRRLTIPVGLFLFLMGIAIPPSDTAPALARQAPGEELKDGLRFVPADAALFVYIDVPKVWNSDVVKGVRKADSTNFDILTQEAKQVLGLAPEDLASVVLFMPQLKLPNDTEALGVVLTFAKPGFDKERLTRGIEKLLPASGTLKVSVPDDRTAIVLLNLKADVYGKPLPAKNGPLSHALKAAASGKYAAVAGITPGNLPEELRGDDLPEQLRPFKPLAEALSIAATLDLEPKITLDLLIKTGTARQAGDCEKALAAFLNLVQTELEPKVKDFEKNPDTKELAIMMKGVIAAAKGAKFSTLGNETQLTLSLAGDLPFGRAFVSTRKLVQEASAAVSSANNLKQIAIAMHHYEGTYQNFPPAAVCDKTGKPLLSWRVLILPYIEQEELYKQFKLDEPWDSEHNKKLLGKMPKVYSVPGKTPPGDTNTYYRVFVGNGAGFDWLMGTKLNALADGTSNTLMCVTAAEAVPWTKPDELGFDPDKDMTQLIGQIVNGRAQVAMFDGSVRNLKKVPGKDTLKALITRAGGEVVDDLD